jgi:hypothetical protein
MEASEGDVRRRNLDLDLMEGSALMVPPVKRKDAEQLRRSLRLQRLICLRSTHAFRYNLHVEAGNG